MRKNKHMKYLILLNSTKYSYHNDFADMLRDILMGITKDSGDEALVDVIDMSSNGPQYEKYYAIEKAKADLIFNLDLAGFELMTEGDNISLNGIPCRTVNILFQKPEIYGSDLKFRQNLSMFTYFPKRVVKNSDGLMEIANRYSDIPNPMIFCEYDYKASADKEITANRENVQLWVDQMFSEVHL